MFDDSRFFITRAFLRAEFDLDYRAYTPAHDTELLRSSPTIITRRISRCMRS